LAQGDRLGIGLRNSVQFVLATFAGWKLGAVPVPVRWDVPDWELGRLREVVTPTLFLGIDDLAWIDATAGGEVPELADAVSPHMNGICSSGSTGTPKVILTMRTGEYDPALAPPFIAQWAPVERPQRVLVLGPMYHANGLSSLFSLLNADQVVAMEKFDAARVVDAVERLGVTTFTATPTMLQRIADLPAIEQRDLSGLRWILQGSAPMPPALMHRWIGLIGAERIVMTYGMTEGLGTTGMRADEWLEHQGSVGAGCATPRSASSARPGKNYRRARSATSTCARRSSGASPISALPPSCRAPPTGSRASATWNTSTPTATSTWSTAAWI
jgi:bile acid-coenzyme A ligase